MQDLVEKVGALTGCLAAALRVAGSIPSWNKYLYGLHEVIPGVCECEFKYF